MSLNRYEVKIRTPKGNETMIRTVEVLSKSSMSAGCIVLHMLDVESPNLSLSIRKIRETKHA